MGYYKTKRPFLVKYVIKTNRLKTGNTRPLKLKSLEVKVDNNITSRLSVQNVFNLLCTSLSVILLKVCKLENIAEEEKVLHEYDNS
jgi:hypothetical protein